MYRVCLFTLFVILLSYYIYLEQQYIFIYYTIWTFGLETVFFGCLILEDVSTLAKRVSDTLFPLIFAPSLLVAIGFWVVVAPFSETSLAHLSRTVVTHGLNAVAMCIEIRPICRTDIWKPVTYTAFYNIFLYVYVQLGGRSVSGKLPYWYAQYESYLGWLFAALAVLSVTVIHFGMALAYPPGRPVTSKQCIV